MDKTYLLFSERLKSKRKQKQFSLQALADHADVSKSLISKIENGQVQPTIETACRIAEGLNSSLSEMFQIEKAGSVVHHSAEQQFSIDDGEHLKKIMSPSVRNACIEIFHENLDSGARIKPTTYFDADKYILSLNGGLSVKTKDSTYALREGDCLHLEKQVEHSLKNRNGSEVKFITIIHHLHQ
mgnify:CR=1 FL=1